MASKEDLSALSPLRLYTLASALTKKCIEGSPSAGDREAALTAIDACTAAVAAAGDAPTTSDTAAELSPFSLSLTLLPFWKAQLLLAAPAGDLELRAQQLKQAVATLKFFRGLVGTLFAPVDGRVVDGADGEDGEEAILKAMAGSSPAAQTTDLDLFIKAGEAELTNGRTGDAAAAREERLARARREMELKKAVAEAERRLGLASAPDGGNDVSPDALAERLAATGLDEGVLHELRATQVWLAAAESVGALRGAAQEMEMVEFGRKRLAAGPGAGVSRPQPAAPFTVTGAGGAGASQQLHGNYQIAKGGMITPLAGGSRTAPTHGLQHAMSRAEREAAVLRQFHTAPTETLEQLADREVADAIERQQADAEMEAAKAAEDPEDEAIIDRDMYKAREWDNYKDEHKKGDGNRMGK